MELLSTIFQYFLDLGAAVFVPIIMIIAGALGGLHDLLGGLVDELMIVGLETDADHFLVSCHGLFLLKNVQSDAVPRFVRREIF